MAFCRSIASSSDPAVISPSTGPKHSVRWNHDPGATPSRTPGVHRRIAQVPRLDQPRLAVLERRQRPLQLRREGVDQRAHRRREVAPVAHPQRAHRVGELAPEAPPDPRARVARRAHEDRQRRRRALLAGVPERGAQQVRDGEVRVRGGRDHQRVLARRLGDQRQVGAPRAEQRRRLARPGQHDPLDGRVRDQPLPGRALVGVHERQRVGRDAGPVQRRDADLRARPHLRRRLDDDGGPRGQRREAPAQRDRDREVPRRGHDDDAGRGEPRRVQFLGAVGVVRGEVDGLGDLRVGLGDGLARLVDHRRQQLGARRGQRARGLAEQAGALGGRGVAPGRGGGPVHDGVDRGRVGQLGLPDDVRARRLPRAGPSRGWRAARGRCRARCGTRPRRG